MKNEGSNWGKWDLHIHTPSSFDYSYSGEEYFDENLVQAWKEKGFLAVAVTDHFLIDGNRIRRLQDLAEQEGITVFPGVEYRTDKGDKNVHIISIFSNEIDVIGLSKYFNYNMIKGKAKHPDKNSTIYWNLEDIVEFTKKYDGVLTVHAGNKASGIDKTMNNGEFFRQIKMEYAGVVDAFEVNNLHSYEGYKEIVIPSLERTFEKEFPVIISSDNHDCNDYKTTSNLWIKADPTFEGLKQAFLHPAERIFIGDKPEKIIHRETNPKSIMKSISIKKKLDANNNSEWFNSEIPLNSSLVAIIGNKGSGKSALSDILGVVNNCIEIEDLSFLNNKRFNKAPSHFGKDYEAELTWLDDKKTQLDSLFIKQTESSTISATAQYLPQQYIEEICTNLDTSIFQSEINKLIFSYIAQEEKLHAKNFEEFIVLKTKTIEMELKPLYDEIEEVNHAIIELEEKKREEYQSTVRSKRDERQSDLDRQMGAKPKEVPQPVNNQNNEQLVQLGVIDTQIEVLNIEIRTVKENFERQNINHQKLMTIKSELTLLIGEIEQKNSKVESLFNELDLECEGFKIEFTDPSNKYVDQIARVEREKESLYNQINSEEGLEVRLEKLRAEKREGLEHIDNDNRAYQAYLTELKTWESTIEEIKGSNDIQGSLAYFEAEYEYLNNKLSSEYSTLLEERLELVRKVYEKKMTKKTIFDDVYEIIDSEITQTLGDLNQDIQFKTQIIIQEEEIQELLNHVNKRAQSRFQGSDESKREMTKLISELDVNDFDSVNTFLENILNCGIHQDFEQLNKVIRNKSEYYLQATTLKYLEVDYHLSYNGNTLDELSPGERGLMLLVFYLSLSRDEKPIIIDQPEDNLDNQSVYSRLVPCIIAAKKKRQVIVVTHNPNIAIACDAEQVIIADIDKGDNKIQYTAGSIENKVINKKIVEILEGTKPAFRLRGSKYID